MKRLLQPTFQSGYAKGPGDSEFPNLWNGLIGLWAPSVGYQGVTTLQDFSGNGAHATIAGSKSVSDWNRDDRGSSLRFDGSTAGASIARIPRHNITASLSIFAWLNPPSALGGYPMIVCRGSINSSYLLFFNGGKVHFRIYNGAFFSDVLGTTVVPTSTWSFVGATFNGYRSDLYYNGKLENYSTNSTRAVLTPGGTTYLFSSLTLGYNLSALMGEIYMYDRGLSPDEVQQLYLGASPLQLRRKIFGKAPATAAHISNIPKGAITATPQTPTTVTTNKHISNIALKTLSITGQTPSIITTTVTANVSNIPAGSITATPQTPTTVTTNRHISNIPKGVITAAPQTPTTVTTNKHISNIPKGAITATPQAPSIVVTTVAGNTSNIPKGVITATPQTPTTVTTNKHISNIPKGSITLTGQAPSVVTTEKHISNVALKSLSITGRTPSIVTSSVDSQTSQLPLKTLSTSVKTPSITTTEKHVSGVAVKTLDLQEQTPTVVTTTKHLSLVSLKTLTLTKHTPLVVVTGGPDVGAYRILQAKERDNAFTPKDRSRFFEKLK